MNEQSFEKVVQQTIKEIEETLVVKGREYRRNNNPFHNFERGAQISGDIREKILDGFLLKHEISIKDMTEDLEKGILPKTETVVEKFNDNIIYLILKKASIIDRIQKKEAGKILKAKEEFHDKQG